jgi:DNA-binding CsgD family transcriptional regulator
VPQRPTSEDELTERQRDVLRLVREGKNPTEIGKELEISSQGVHGHLRRLRAGTG